MFPAKQVWIRRLYALHRVTGLVFALNLLVLSGTGAILIFRHEIDEALGLLGGTPPALLDAPAFVAELLPAITYDFELALRDQPAPLDRVRAPLWVYAGDADGIVPASLAREWSRYTSGPFVSHIVPGAGHFLPQTHAAALRALLAEPLGL
jgi:surfactin synthase thioesterase subunit